jgi:Dihydrodipicolinate synthase/N-acetylneuraminate lyase
MSEIKGIYAASLSILDENLALNINKTIKHAESIINLGCHGVAIFGSTGQAQLISISEKIQLINKLSNSKYKEKFIIGSGLNSLSETINLMKISSSLNFKKFLIMPPAYYKYGDDEVINYYSKIIENIKDCKIILYNFEKLCGYKFSKKVVEELAKKFPEQIVGIKDSSYNLFETLKIKNFSILVWI